MTHTFRAFWPILDDSMTFPELCAEALPTVPLLAAQARARIVDGGRFSAVDSRRIPGAGRCSARVLVYEARAVPMAKRPYWRGVA